MTKTVDDLPEEVRREIDMCVLSFTLNGVPLCTSEKLLPRASVERLCLLTLERAEKARFRQAAEGDTPRAHAIVDAYLEKEALGTEDTERDLLVPIGQLERELAEANAERAPK